MSEATKRFKLSLDVHKITKTEEIFIIWPLIDALCDFGIPEAHLMAVGLLY